MSYKQNHPYDPYDHCDLWPLEQNINANTFFVICILPSHKVSSSHVQSFKGCSKIVFWQKNDLHSFDHSPYDPKINEYKSLYCHNLLSTSIQVHSSNSMKDIVQKVSFCLKMTIVTFNLRPSDTKHEVQSLSYGMQEYLCHLTPWPQNTK